MIPRTQESLMFLCFYLSIVFGFIIYFSSYISDSLRIFSYFASIATGYFGIILYASQRLQTNKALRIWLVLFFYMLIMGIIMNWLGIGSYSASNLLSQDLRYCMYVAIGFVYSDEKYIKKFFNLASAICILGIIFALYGLSIYDFDLSKVIRGSRIDIWELPYYCWWVSETTVLILFAYSLVTGKKRIISYSCLVLYLILALLFLKREPFVYTSLIFGICQFLSSKKHKVVQSIALLLLIIALLSILSDHLPYLSALIGGVGARFKEAYETSSRVNEVEYFRKISSWGTLFWGYGIGNEYIQDGVHKNAIHIGFYDAIYKGGVFFLFYYATLLTRMLRLLISHFTHRKALTSVSIISIALTCAALVSLSFSMSFSYAMTILNFSPAFGIILNYDRYDYDKICDL